MTLIVAVFAAPPIQNFIDCSVGVLMTYSCFSQSNTAVVSIPLTLEPCPSSVRPKHPTSLNLKMSFANFACFSVPKFLIVLIHKVKPTPILIVIGKE